MAEFNILLAEYNYVPDETYLICEIYPKLFVDFMIFEGYIIYQ